MSKLTVAIANKKKELIEYANIHGVYENFGQKEVSELKHKFINISDYSKFMNFQRLLIDNFDHWASNYSCFN